MKRLNLLFFLVVMHTILSAQPAASEMFTLINTSYDEQSPVISPDGKLLFFTIGNHPQNIGGKRDPGDIWFSVLSGGQWTAPVHGGPLLNNSGYNAVAGVSADGNQLFLLSHYDASGNPARTQGISVSQNNGNGWSKPENISIPYFQNRSLMQGHLSADGSVFVFSADTYGSRGVEDIYVSIKTDGKWSEPKNAGDKINTKFQELSPSVSQDGRTLYFSTNGKKGFGSFDVFSSTRLDDTWTNWSDPVNIGSEINSNGRELFFKDYAYAGYSLYTRSNNSDGYGDIEVFRPDTIPDEVLITSKPLIDTVVKIEEIRHAVTDDKIIYVHGKITNAKNGEVVNSKLVFEVNGKSITADAPDGNYKIELSSTDSYVIRIEAPGFVSDMENLDMNTYEMKELEMNFRLQPIEIGTTVRLKNVLFIQSKAELLPESYPELDLVVQFMKANPHIVIELSGHTDNRGSFSQLLSLSSKRVSKVKSYLVSKGIQSKRIIGKGYGGSKPIASNDTEETRMLNRRVEFTIKKL